MSDIKIDALSSVHPGNTGAQPGAEPLKKADNPVESGVASFEPTEDFIQKNVEFLNEIGSSLSPRRIEFNVLMNENIVQARILHKDTEELIRAIPPDELIELRKKLLEFMGLFFDMNG